MKDEIKNLYEKLSGGKIITSDDYILSRDQFTSVLFDRFSSELKKKKIIWEGENISFIKLTGNKKKISKQLFNNSDQTILNNNFLQENVFSVGVDIQKIKDFPKSKDYWEDEFYKSKFTHNEIGYCLTKENPLDSFCGIFSCKESLVKANNNLKFNDIEISYDKNGKPSFKDYLISISHSYDYAISIALKYDSNIFKKEKSHIQDFKRTIEIKYNNLNRKVYSIGFLFVINFILSLIILFKFFL